MNEIWGKAFDASCLRVFAGFVEDLADTDSDEGRQEAKDVFARQIAACVDAKAIAIELFGDEAKVKR